jgi:formylglycine-generating enzyme required for sulfatase activity
MTEHSYSTDSLMVQVAGGAFQMGGNETAYPNEQPVHSVTVGFFNMEKYEVTYEK